VKYSDLAPVIEEHWITPLVASLTGKNVPRVDPAAPAVDALNFVLRWLGEPHLDLTTLPDVLRLQAMLKIAAIHNRARHDSRALSRTDAKLGLDGAARKLLRVNIEAMIEDALH
jgi:hypothetical protein